LPDEAEVQRARQRTGYRKLQVRADPPAVRKEAGDVMIDLNAVAPGYAVDAIVERFASLGIRHCMVEIGGEIRVMGRSRSGKAWRIAVEKPVGGESEPYAVLELDGAAVATSGEYRPSYTRDGRRSSHTIDPRTGRPVDHDLASVVVVATSALEADGWATALNVLGPERGHALALQLGISALFIVSDGRELRYRATPGFENYLAVSPHAESLTATPSGASHE
jgi:thiamine biosynthesis lipoprotein